MRSGTSENRAPVEARPLLNTVTGPDDLRAIPPERLPDLAAEIRAELLEIVSRCGGHLASNLGVVELTIALLRVFDPASDRILWDTSHQGYIYKMLTGRRQALRELRRDNGCCGFLHRQESPYDVFGAGHAGTAISAALGFAAARDRRRHSSRVVAVVGDGALGTGVALEGLNSIIETTADFILILNDNRMSIAPNVGALSRYLNRMIAGRRYNRFKTFVADLVSRIPRIGPGLRQHIRRLETATKSVLVPGGLFEELGLRYIGPLDGHDLPQLLQTLESARALRQPLVVHVLTEKGHGYAPAAEAPEDFHGLSPDTPAAAGTAACDQAAAAAVTSFSQVLGESLCELMATSPEVISITAGMGRATGLDPVRNTHADRFFDVGIAEEHAVVFAAGLAAAGLRPTVAIYATFMQRAMDYVFHDVCLQNLPVVFCLDRAGVVADGPTHHGILDLAFWRALPNLSVLQPADDRELREMLSLALKQDGPVILRYPKGAAAALPATARAALEWGRAEVLCRGPDLAIWALGREAVTALELAERLRPHGIAATVVNTRFFMPLDTGLLYEQLGAGIPILTLEDHCVDGGLGTAVREAAAEHGGGRVRCRGWPREAVPWGSEQGLRRRYGLTAAALLADVLPWLGTPDSAAAPENSGIRAARDAEQDTADDAS